MLHLIFAKRSRSKHKSADSMVPWSDSVSTQTESSQDFNTTVATIMQLYHSDLFQEAEDRLQTPNNSLQDFSELMILHTL